MSVDQGYDELINIQLEVLEKFYNLDIKTNDTYVYYKSTWNKYKDNLKLDNNKVSEEYTKIEEKLEKLKKKFFNEQTSKKSMDKYTCNTVKKNNDDAYRVKMIIDLKISFFLESFENKTPNYYNKIIVDDIIYFFKWSESIFSCIDNMYIFQPKYEQILYEAEKSIKENVFDEEKYKELLNIYKKIKFTKSWMNKPEPMLIGNIDSTKFRNCDLLSKKECNNECYTSWFSNGCKKRKDISNLIFNSFCGSGSYRFRSELISIIRSYSYDETEAEALERLSNPLNNRIKYKGDYIDLSKLKKKELCQILNEIMINISKEMGESDQSKKKYFKEKGFGRNQIEKCLYILSDTDKYKNSYLTKYQALVHFLIENRYKIVGIGIIASAILVFYYGVIGAVELVSTSAASWLRETSNALNTSILEWYNWGKDIAFANETVATIFNQTGYYFDVLMEFGKNALYTGSMYAGTAIYNTIVVSFNFLTSWVSSISGAISYLTPSLLNDLFGYIPSFGLFDYIFNWENAKEIAPYAWNFPSFGYTFLKEAINLLFSCISSDIGTFILSFFANVAIFGGIVASGFSNFGKGLVSVGDSKIIKTLCIIFGVTIFLGGLLLTVPSKLIKWTGKGLKSIFNYDPNVTNYFHGGSKAIEYLGYYTEKPFKALSTGGYKLAVAPNYLKKLGKKSKFVGEKIQDVTDLSRTAIIGTAKFAAKTTLLAANTSLFVADNVGKIILKPGEKLIKTIFGDKEFKILETEEMYIRLLEKIWLYGKNIDDINAKSEIKTDLKELDNIYNNISKMTGCGINHDVYIPCTKILPTRTDVQVFDILNITNDYLKGDANYLYSESINLVLETINNEEKYYLLDDGYKRWYSALSLSKYKDPSDNNKIKEIENPIKLRCSVFRLKPNMKFEEFFNKINVYAKTIFPNSNNNPNIQPPNNSNINMINNFQSGLVSNINQNVNIP